MSVLRRLAEPGSAMVTARPAPRSAFASISPVVDLVADGVALVPAAAPFTSARAPADEQVVVDRLGSGRDPEYPNMQPERLADAEPRPSTVRGPDDEVAVARAADATIVPPASVSPPRPPDVRPRPTPDPTGPAEQQEPSGASPLDRHHELPNTEVVAESAVEPPPARKPTERIDAMRQATVATDSVAIGAASSQVHRSAGNPDERVLVRPAPRSASESGLRTETSASAVTSEALGATKPSGFGDEPASIEVRIGTIEIQPGAEPASSTSGPIGFADYAATRAYDWGADG